MTKKNFKKPENPALNIISQGAPSAAGSQEDSAPQGYKPNPRYIEKKSKRVNLLMQPTTVARAKAAAASLNISMNEFINKTVKAELNRLENEREAE